MTERLSKYPDLLAWVGEDGGKIGIKQALCTAGCCICGIATSIRSRCPAHGNHTEHGKTIRVVRYVAVEELVTLAP